MEKPKEIEDLENNIEQPEPIVTEYEYEIDGVVHDPGIIIGKPSFWDKAKRSILSGSTFDFLRHFIIGFVGVGGTTIATTGNLLYAVVAGTAGGLVEGGRKVWSGSTAKKNGGTKNRVLEALLKLVVALIDYWLNRRKEGEDDKGEG